MELQTRVLIADDQQPVREGLRSLLALSSQVEVVGEAPDGQDALKLVAERHPDVVLMDIKLKGPMDGVSATHRIQTSLDIPVIYLTASSDTETVKRALHSSPYGYIIKPFREKDLYDAIRNALNRHKGRRGPS